MVSSSARGQVGQVAEAEQLEEHRRGAVEQRAAERLAPSDHLDQSALLQRAQHAARRHPADLLDLGPADRLPVGDHGQRLERRGGELGRPHRELGPLDRGRVHRPGEDLVAAGQLDQLDAVLLEVVVLADLLQRHAHVGQRRVRVQGGQLFDGERAARRRRARPQAAGRAASRAITMGEKGAGCASRRAPRLASSSSASRVESTSTMVGRGPERVEPADLAPAPRAGPRCGGWRPRHRAGGPPPGAAPARGSPAITRSTACSSSSRSRVSGGGGSSGGGGR